MSTTPTNADQLKAWRALLQLTQTRAAEELGLKLRQYQNLEAGVTPVNLTLQKLAARIAKERVRQS